VSCSCLRALLLVLHVLVLLLLLPWVHRRQWQVQLGCLEPCELQQGLVQQRAVASMAHLATGHCQLQQLHSAEVRQLAEKVPQLHGLRRLLLHWLLLLLLLLRLFLRLFLLLLLLLHLLLLVRSAHLTQGLQW
jgi:hypothetical protein